MNTGKRMFAVVFILASFIQLPTADLDGEVCSNAKI